MPDFIDIATYDGNGNEISRESFPAPPPPPPDERSATVAATRILIAPTVRTLDAQPMLAELAPLFPAWAPGEAVKVADFRTSCGGAVFECVQAHTTQTGWEPPVVPALWKQYRAPGAQWVQPLGAQDAYPLGAIVTDAGKTWRSVNAANVWQPPTQWVEVTS
jgi:hypothetical protein